MPRAHGCAGVAMYRKYRQKTAPAFSAYTPSMALYATGAWMRRSGDVQEVRAEKFRITRGIMHGIGR